MTTQETRRYIQERLNSVDERFLNAIYSMLRSYLDDNIIGYEPNGLPISSKELLSRAEESEKAISEGRVTDFEDFEKETENW